MIVACVAVLFECVMLSMNSVVTCNKAPFTVLKTECFHFKLPHARTTQYI